MAFGESLSLDSCLENVTQSGWFGTPTKLSLSLFKELGIDQINDYSGSYMKIILKFLLDSNIVLVRSLFFWTFCEKSLIFLKIIS